MISKPTLKAKSLKLKANRGQSLVEILVSLGIFSIVVGAVFFLFFGGQSLSLDSSNAQIAAEYASEGMEAVRSIRDRDWDELSDGDYGLIFSGGQWNLSGSSDTRDIFTRIATITASSTNPNAKDVKLAVNWQTDPTRLQKVELAALLTSWKNPLVGGCSDDPLSGNWASPVVLGSADLGPGSEGTDVVVKLPYVFVSAVASAAGKSDLFVFDVSNPANPSLVRQIDIGAGGINSLFLKDNYLYAASANNSRELIIFNISDPPNTTEAGILDLAGEADGLSVYGVESTVYLGRKETTQNELVVIDTTTPAAPSVITSFQIGDDVNDISASNQKLYLVSEESNNNVWVYNISNPAAPALLNSFNLQQGGELISAALRLPGDLLVGDESNQFFVLGATTTSQIYVRDSIFIGGATNDIVCVANSLAFLATGNSTKEFIILNIANLDDITEYASLNFPQLGTGIDFADNMVFMSVRSNDALRIITSQ